MPETPGPSAEHPYGQDPNFEEARALGLTPAEYATLRLTGELPERIERLNRTTYQAQTRSYAGHIPSSPFPSTGDESATHRPSQRSSLNQTRRTLNNPFGFTAKESAAIKRYLAEKHGHAPEEEEDASAIQLEPLPPMPDYEHFKLWALAQLDQVKSQIGQILDGDPEAISSAEVFARAHRFSELYHGGSLRRSFMDRDPDVPPAVGSTWPLVDDILARPDLSLDTRADLVDGIMQMRDSLKRSYLDSKLEKDIPDHGPELAVQLLGRPGDVGDRAAEAISRVLSRSKDIELINETGLQAIMPLVTRLKDKSSIYSRDIDTIHVIVADIDASDETLAKARDRGVNLEQVATDVVDTFNPNTESGRRLPHHTEMAEILSLLVRLYYPKHDNPQAMSADLPALLERIYQDQVLRYEHHVDMTHLAAPYNRLAEGCGVSHRV